jgi:formylglycine-generating enzyme required for sulfatase activity/energy-coupling factor transporter ATP-binding protein EcfA2
MTPEPPSTYIGGNVHAGNDVVLRDQYNITQIIRIPSFTPPPDLEKLRADYLAHLCRNYRALDFKGIPQLDALTKELLLEEVYVPLVARPDAPEGETWERRLAGRHLRKETLPEDELKMLEKGDPRPIKVEEALGKQPRVVVLGDPGSGKSTLLKYLTLRLAAEPGAPLPILLPLNAYAAALAKVDLNLQDYLPQYFAGLAQGLAGLQPLFDLAIQNGQAVVLLDGLDEVQSETVRALLVGRVEAFATESKVKMAVTSRVVGYRESPLHSRQWALYTLLDFDRTAIEAFAGRWCLAFEKSILGDSPEAGHQAEIERRSLLEALDTNPGVAQLASNPLLLTILALIKRQGVDLPNRRVELYELYLKTLITAWSKARALDKRPVGPLLDYLQVIKVLGPLALWLREKNPTAGLVLEEILLEWLVDYIGRDRGLPPGRAIEEARQFLDNVRRYSNLLLERGRGRYGFIHLTFEEALAARGLVQLGQLRLDNSLDYIQRHISDPAWRETILLAVGVWGIVREEFEKAGEVVRAMLRMLCGEDDPCRNVLIAGACLEDVGEIGLGREPAAEVIQALIVVSLNRDLPPLTQRDAGFILGRLAGSNPDFLKQIRPDLEEWVQIPAGEFLYGDEKKVEVIREPFAIAKYPVTNLQYRQFVEAGGYEQCEFWSETGWGWRRGTYDGQVKDKSIQYWLARRPPEKRSEPYYWHDLKWNNPLAPVVGVTWFEAEAYANWLAKQRGCAIRLPTEQEWERAARGTKGREYTWGDVFTGKNLNCAEFWMQNDQLDRNKWQRTESRKGASPTLVGQFPGGNTPEGVSDLSGNVWEWTASWYDKEQINHVLRGVSWDGHRGYACCAYRFWYVPVDFYYSVGFRVLSSGIFPDSV